MAIVEIITWIFFGAAWGAAAFVTLLLWSLCVVAKDADKRMGVE